MAAGYKQELSGLAAGLANQLGMLDGYRILRKRLFKSQVAILMYHRIEPRENSWFFPYSITASDFENQLVYLLKHYTILSLEELVEDIYEQKPLPEKAAVLTFDDGYKDNYIYAYPILKKYSIPATVFLTTGYIGNGEISWWDKITYVLQHTTGDVLELDDKGTYSLKTNNERSQAVSLLINKITRLPKKEKNTLIEKIVMMSAVNIPAGLGKEKMLSWEEVREMNQGGIAFGAHSVTHMMLTELLPEQARREIVESRETIEEKLDRPVTAFSYPGGRFSRDTTALLKENNFRCALTSIPRMTTPESNPYELGRIVGGWTYAVFKALLFGLYSDFYTASGRIKGRQSITLRE